MLLTVEPKRFSIVLLVPPLFHSVTEQGPVVINLLAHPWMILFNRKKIKSRKSKVPSFYFDIEHLANYWGIDGNVRRSVIEE